MFFTETWRPDSFYDRILANRKQGLHTLCLLVIKVKEPTLESLARGKKIYEPPRFMSIETAISQLLEIEERLKVLPFLSRYCKNLVSLMLAETLNLLVEAFLGATSASHPKIIDYPTEC